MTSYNKPLPNITAHGREFWEGTKRHELLIQECKDCGTKVFYPKIFCPQCGSSNLGWIKASGKGSVYSYSSSLGKNAPSAFLGDVPYTIAIIRLEEGVQLMSTIVECSPEDVKCDMDVEVVFDDVTEEITLPRFKPVR